MDRQDVQDERRKAVMGRCDVQEGRQEADLDQAVALEELDRAPNGVRTEWLGPEGQKRASFPHWRGPRSPPPSSPTAHGLPRHS